MQNPKERPLEFIEFLNRYLPWLNSQVDTEINAGGCSVFALILYNVLVGLGFSPVIVALFDAHRGNKHMSDAERETFDDAIKQPHIEKEAGPDHVLLRLFKDLYIDSTGIVSTGIEFLNSLEPISLAVLERINTEIEWNSEYDKELTPRIKTLVEVIPQEFENYLNGKEFPLPTEGIHLNQHTVTERKKHHGGGGLDGILEGLTQVLEQEEESKHG